MRRYILLIAAITTLTFSSFSISGACTATSPAHTLALVELYTSEGCDSCPPADRWLSALGARGYVPSRVVPIALHVDYWDYIGWKDPFANRAFSNRQRRLAELHRATTVYTPQVVVQGQDFRRWSSLAELDAALQKIEAQPARARITLGLAPITSAALEVDLAVAVPRSADRANAAVYLARYENRLVSEVRAGENRGKTLAHDFVVFDWKGPISLDQAGNVSARYQFSLLPKAVTANTGVMAFVQDRRSLDVLQALMLPACTG
ncbi:MAG: DUF1223 domain-containing protein [Proteobacteria bacterium]|nr:DUF1223 domain-containing protein [Pseudomonadota bacterium]